MGRGWWHGATRLLALLARPARRARGERGVVVEPYRGYGSPAEVFLIGRVFRQSRPEREAGPLDVRAHLRDIGRRIRRRKIAGARLTARFCGAQARLVTDRDGYFRCHLHLAHPPPPGGPWHRVALSLEAELPAESPAEAPVELEAEVFIPPPGCRFAVVSDIDDTVMRTGVANKAKMLWRLFVADAESRVAFPGAAALYRALYAGAGGGEGNPMLYVSRAPWGIYEMLTEFFRLHDIPAGPILFLREWGLSWRRPWPRRATDHKGALIRHMLALYADLPFVLIGDSGQHDPEVYAGLVEAHPGRIAAVYIRDVSRGPGRREAIARLARAVAAAGTPLVLAADSQAIAEHAAGLGLIARAGVTAVAGERTRDGDGDTSIEAARTHHVTAPEGGLDGLIDQERANVVIEPLRRT